jgi:hypothetical protein
MAPGLSNSPLAPQLLFQIDCVVRNLLLQQRTSELSPLCGGQLRYLSIHLSVGRGPRTTQGKLVREHAATAWGCARSHPTPAPLGAFAEKKVAFTTDRRVVKLRISNNGVDRLSKKPQYAAQRITVILRYESAGGSVGGIERRPKASPTCKSYLPAQQVNGWFCQFGRPFVEIVSTL